MQNQSIEDLCFLLLQKVQYLGKKQRLTLFALLNCQEYPVDQIVGLLDKNGLSPKLVKSELIRIIGISRNQQALIKEIYRLISIAEYNERRYKIEISQPLENCRGKQPQLRPMARKRHWQ